MVNLNRACLLILVALVAACGSTSENPKLFGGAGGAAGTNAAGAAGLGDDAGWPSGGAAGADAGRCPEHMIDRGTYCIDDRPAIYVNGGQGLAVPWANANENCSSIRGLRLCTEDERESTCAVAPYATFCVGPAGTWEWSATSCSSGRRLSPCCTVVQGFGQCETDETKLQSFHCCKDI